MKPLLCLLSILCYLSLPHTALSDWSPAPNTADSPSTPLLRLQTIETGIYRVSAKEVAENTGIELSKLTPETMNLYYKGEAVPIWVENTSNEGWNEDGYFEFFGTFLEGTFSTRGMYSEKRSYFLVEDSQEPERYSFMRPGPNLPELPAGTLYSTFHHEAYYTSGFWHYDGEEFDYFGSFSLETGKSWDREFTLHDLDWDHGTITLRGKIYGRSNLPPNPDHHVVMSLNEVIVADFTFDGAREYYFSETVPKEIINEKKVRFQAEAPGDLLKEGRGAKFDVLVLDWVALDYPSTLTLHRDRLDVKTKNDTNQSTTCLGKFNNFWGTDKRLYDVGNGLRLSLGEDSSAPVLINKDTRIIAANQLSTLSPIEITPVNTSEITKQTALNQLVIITHPDLINEANRLATHKNNTGMPTCVVSIEDIYNQFNNGLKEPIAIHHFVKKVYDTENTQLKYVLLAGSACKDPKMKSSNTEGNIDYIPTRYFRSWLYPPYPWDTWYGSFGEEETIAQVAIGRIPARSPEEFSHTINKIIEFETDTTITGWEHNAVLMASVEDSIISSTEQAGETIQEKHPNSQITRVYADKEQEDTTVWVKQSVEAVNQGCGILLFIGHGATARWGQGPIGRTPKRFLFDLEAVDEISNKGKYPIAIAGTCYSAVFDTDRDIELLGRKLLRAQDRGAIAVIAPSYRSSVRGATDSAKFMTQEILSSENQTLGDAFLKTHNRIKDRETRAALTLLGDPSLRIQRLQ